MVHNFRTEKMVSYNGKSYKVSGYTEGPIKMAIAKHYVKGFGWKPTKSGNTRIKLYNKMMNK